MPTSSEALQAPFVLEGRIVGVSDGDTVTLLDAGKKQHRVRLAGIDAPESSQAFGQKSKANLARLSFGKDASLLCHVIDRYKRPVCKISVNGVDVNYEQVKAGLAWFNKPYAREYSQVVKSSYAGAEAGARASRTGLWADIEPQEPWAWRKGKKAKKVERPD